uniref:Uncharacterized protein n=1 Tax=Rhizophora mucronata TaxID=61149 RepID=A0A2P2R4Z1_RHIMU
MSTLLHIKHYYELPNHIKCTCLYLSGHKLAVHITIRYMCM